MNRTIAIAGPKNSGKSTVVEWLVRERGYKAIALADKIKVLAAHVFPRTLSHHDLYGPSQARERLFTNAEKRVLMVEIQAGATWMRLDPDGREFIKELFTDHDPEQRAPTRFVQALDPLDENAKSPRKILQRMGTEWGRAIWDEVWLNAVRRTVTAERLVRYAIADCRFPNEAVYLRKELDTDVYWLNAEERLKGQPRDPHISEPDRADMIDHCTGEIDNNAGLDELYARLTKLFPAQG